MIMITDLGIGISTSNGLVKWAYGGDFGEVEHDGNFCLNGLNWPDRSLSVITESFQQKNKFIYNHISTPANPVSSSDANGLTFSPF